MKEIDLFDWKWPSNWLAPYFDSQLEQTRASYISYWAGLGLDLGSALDLD